MRIELDKPLTKTKLRQSLKLLPEGKRIKIIMGTEIFDIDTIVSKGDTIYLCTNSKQTADFYSEKEKNEDGVVNRFYKYKNTYRITSDKDWEEKWEEYRKKHNLPKYYIGDCPGFQPYVSKNSGD